MLSCHLCLTIYTPTLGDDELWTCQYRLSEAADYKVTIHLFWVRFFLSPLNSEYVNTFIWVKVFLFANATNAIVLQSFDIHFYKFPPGGMTAPSFFRTFSPMGPLPHSANIARSRLRLTEAAADFGSDFGASLTLPCSVTHGALKASGEWFNQPDICRGQHILLR